MEPLKSRIHGRRNNSAPERADGLPRPTAAREQNVKFKPDLQIPGPGSSQETPLPSPAPNRNMFLLCAVRFLMYFMLFNG